MQYQFSVPSHGPKRGARTRPRLIQRSGLRRAIVRPGRARSQNRVVECEIEQRAIEIEQHGVDAFPIVAAERTASGMWRDHTSYAGRRRGAAQLF